MMLLALLFLAPCFAPAIEPKAEPSTLLTTKRVFVDKFGGGETASQIRDMVISSLQSSGLFVLTENPERADVTLKGSGEDLVFTEQHSTSDGIDVHASTSIGSSTRNYTSSRSADGIGVGEHESTHGESRRRHHLVHHQGKPGRQVSWSQRRCGR
jgi:hypothetical protein